MKHSHIPKLDDFLGGGIPEGVSLLFCAYPGVECEAFGYQILHGILENDDKGFIYTNVRQFKKYTANIETFVTQTQYDREISREKIEKMLPDLNSLIQDTISGSQMIKEIVDNLRSFSHLDEAKWKTVNIHDGIESSLKIMMAQFKRHLKIHKNFKSHGIISCNPGQLNQVFLNILSNAAQAINESGHIWINTYDKNDNLMIEIKDDGKGMSPQILDKIFDPFFTTKDVGEGTGLGLSISYSIIQNHHGTITAESKSGKGSTFTIKIPYKQEVITND